MIKIKNLLLSLAILLIVILNVGCSYTFKNDYNIGNSGQYNQTVTNLTPINVNSQTDRSEMVEKYLEAAATVLILDELDNVVSMGSGIAIYAGGYIATNWHVINNIIYYPDRYSIYTEILVDGEYEAFEAKLLWSNENFDLAVIRCSYFNMPFVKMKDRWINSIEPLRIAEEVWTVGTPYDLSLRGTYSTGTISSTEFRFSVSNYRVYEYLIQHSSSISNGSSGSGMFDKNGNLLGLNTLGITSSYPTAANDLYFLTPIYPLTNIISQIVALNEDGIDATNY
ncbi:MAG: serine protease, partial [Clostridia bacterium]|nr:serine protease [Clostridia bacterium]